MDNRFKNKFRISPARLAGWDMAPVVYIILPFAPKTGCIILMLLFLIKTLGRTIRRPIDLQKTPIAEIARNYWLDIPNHFPFVELDDFVVMPNHLHGILFINKPDKTDWQPNKFGGQSQNLASIIRNYKGSVKTCATTNNIEFCLATPRLRPVIRDVKEYANVREYIFNNPENWLLKPPAHAWKPLCCNLH